MATSTAALNSPYAALSTSSSSSSSTSTANQANDMQDRFLTLLVAQINSQDPLNPMDNAQMTTQMAQINTVSGIQELNVTLKGMAQQMASQQAMQGATLIGKEVLVEGNSLVFEGPVGKGAFQIDAAASSVKVDVIGINGETLDTIDLGNRTAGQHAFNWDAGSTNLAQVAKFSVRASDGSRTVESDELSPLRINTVGLSNGVMNIQLQDGRSLRYDDIRGYL